LLSRKRLSGRRFRALLAKELRELAVSRATLILFLALGPLVGHALITAVDAYAEASGLGGGAAALAQAISPLDGLVVPLFGAYALASALLLPFVAIRSLSAEKESGAMAVMLQSRATPGVMILAKFTAILVTWIAALLPGVLGLLLWRSYGGHLASAELSNVLLGHMLRAGLVGAVSLAAAALVDGAATAAVVVLAFTLGTWALDFIAQVRGGTAQQLAAFTPDSALRTFERGELASSVVAVTMIATVGLLAMSAWWLHSGQSMPWIWTRVVMSALLAMALALPAARLHPSWDASEDRRNSFPLADALALSRIRDPLEVTVHLAPEDPRLTDLQRGVLRKLERSMSDVRVVVAVTSGTGLFEGPDRQYGEVWYDLGGRRAMSRSTTPEIVLETIYGLAGISRPAENGGSAYPGHPLKARPAYAAPIFYALLPLLTLLLWLGVRRRLRNFS
jgi:ABC-2 type transport system permease protein